ncbi:ATP-binding protein [Sneathiella glossodoripedis]|uniref:ATP-binding protein n=1 Tax=Sneathiella glossodoripedis TaxID=418853 RepID=UPI000471B452|nr:ATP-binding protein [Sneathiella glossodoripedis]
MAVTEKIVVFIDAHPKTYVLLRSAANKAREMKLPWEAVYIETEDHFLMDRESRERILRYSELAEKLGGLFVQKTAKSALDGVTDHIEASNEKGQLVVQVIIGHTSKEGLFAELKTSLAEKVTRRFRNQPIQVQIVPLNSRQYAVSWLDRLRLREVRFIDIFLSIVAVGIAYTITAILNWTVDNTEWTITHNNIAAIFIIASVFVAIQFGLLPSLLTTLLGFSAINFFYISPLNSFDIHSISDGIDLSIYLVASIIISILGAYSQAARTAIQQKEKRSEVLYRINQSANAANDRETALKVLHEDLSSYLQMDVAFFLPPALNPDAIELAFPKNVSFSDNDLQLLDKCWNDVRATGLGTLRHFGSQWRFEPLTSPNGEIGVLAFKIPPLTRLDVSFGRLVTALADQIAAILERIELTKMISESRIREEREKLRGMLLSSVSHDLKTPLASIIGSLSIYRRMQKAGRLTEDTANELTDTALEEAQRLNSFITNILDMTRIESGDIEFSQEWVLPSSLLASMPKRLKQTLKGNKILFDTETEPCEVYADKLMTEQVLQNLIDNAAKYSPANTDIEIGFGPYEDGFAIWVRDFGSGIPDEKMEAVFDKYERLKRSDTQVAGTGLGLAISKAVMEKQEGRIWATNHTEGGAIFTIWFPKWRKVGEERTAS